MPSLNGTGPRGSLRARTGKVGSYCGTGYHGLICEMVHQAVNAARGGYCAHVDNRYRKPRQEAVDEARHWLASSNGRFWMGLIGLDTQAVLEAL